MLLQILRTLGLLNAIIQVFSQFTPLSAGKYIFDAGCQKLEPFSTLL
jgi:hypothetical protein